MGSTGKLVTTIVLLSAIGLGAWYWMAQPKGPPAAEVAEKWARVLRWTGVAEPLGHPTFDGLDKQTETPHIPALRARYDADAIPLVSTDDVPAAYLAEIDALLAWGANPRFEGTCADDGVGPLVVYDRLSAALKIAGPSEIDRAKDVLRVATALRHRGSMLLTFIGLKVTVTVVRWAKARGVAVWPELRAARPTAAEFIRTDAREAVCNDALLARSIADGAEVPSALRRLWRVRAHDRIARLQITNPTFATLKPLIKTETGGWSASAKLMETMEIGRDSMLENFEKNAADFSALVGE